jgi:signal transduction histidine kinase
VLQPPAEPTRFEKLVQASLAISAAHATDQVLQVVVDAAREVVGARYAALGVLGADRHTLVRFVTSGMSAEEHERIGALPSGHGLLGVLIREGKPLRIPRITDDPRRSGFPASHPEMESFLGVPILLEDEVYGRLYLTEKIGADEFSEEDERIATMLATRAGLAVHTTQLIEQQGQLLGQLQTMQRQRDQFHAMINHELRNALTGVFGWAEQLQRAKSSEGVARASREVYESADRTIILLNNLLDLSRLDAGKNQVIIRPVLLHDALESVVAGMRPAAEKKDCAIELEGAMSGLTVRTDVVKLQQIIGNLLSNALRHSPASETVVIRVEAMHGEVLINVIDRGPGIPVDDQERIFEPYIRTDPESGIGSGLGLPVSRRLAELLGGRLTVSSDLGRGAVFILALPLEHAS